MMSAQARRCGMAARPSEKSSGTSKAPIQFLHHFVYIYIFLIRISLFLFSSSSFDPLDIALSGVIIIIYPYITFSFSFAIHRSMAVRHFRVIQRTPRSPQKAKRKRKVADVLVQKRMGRNLPRARVAIHARISFIIWREPFRLMTLLHLYFFSLSLSSLWRDVCSRKTTIARGGCAVTAALQLLACES